MLLVGQTYLKGRYFIRITRLSGNRVFWSGLYGDDYESNREWMENYLKGDGWTRRRGWLGFRVP